MDLKGILATVFAALPDGIAGTCSLTRVTKGAPDAATDVRVSNAPLTMAGLSCVVSTPTPTRVLPPGLTRETALIVSVPAALCTLFAPAFNDTLTLGGRRTTVLEVTPVDPTGADPALYDLLVKRPA